MMVWVTLYISVCRPSSFPLVDNKRKFRVQRLSKIICHTYWSQNLSIHSMDANYQVIEKLSDPNSVMYVSKFAPNLQSPKTFLMVQEASLGISMHGPQALHWPLIINTRMDPFAPQDVTLLAQKPKYVSSWWLCSTPKPISPSSFRLSSRILHVKARPNKGAFYIFNDLAWNDKRWSSNKLEC